MPKTIKITDIDATGRKRPIDPDHAVWLASSIEEKSKGVVGEGLDNAIKVTPRGDGYKLVFGGHRIAAFGILGWTDLIVGKHVTIEELTNDEAELGEIDENLLRADLGPLDRALQLADRKAIYERIYKVDRKGGDRKSAKLQEEINSQSLRIGFSPRFTADVAAKVGLSERAMHLSLRIADALNDLGPEAIRSLRGTRLERNQSELQALCDVDADSRGAVVNAIASGEVKSVAEGRVAIGLDKAVEQDFQKLVIARGVWAWSQADAQSRATLLNFQNAVPKKKGDA